MKFTSIILLWIAAIAPSALSVVIPLHFEWEKEQIILEMCEFRFEQQNSCLGSCVLKDALSGIHDDRAREGHSTQKILNTLLLVVFTMEEGFLMESNQAFKRVPISFEYLNLPEQPIFEVLQPPQLG